MHLPRRPRGRSQSRTSPPLTSVGALLGAAALLLGFTAQAQALVSNTGQTTHGYTACVSGSQPLDCAQGFTTGPHLKYALNAITLDMQRAPGSGITLTVTVRGDNGSGHPSNTVKYTLTNPNLGTAGIKRFNAPFGARLDANSQYFVHVAYSGNGTIPRWNLTTNNAEDSGAATGWSIRNHRHTRQSGGTGGWQGDGGTYSTSMQIGVLGYALVPPAPTNLDAAPGDGEVVLTWDDPNNSVITKYQYRKKAGSGSYGNWSNITGSGATTTTYTATGLTNGTAYTFAVRAVSSAGNGFESTVTAAPLAVPPTVTGLATVDYAENGTAAIATYTIADPDASGTVSVLDLSGDDASQFSLTTTDNADGTVTAELNFIAAPDYEAPTDSGGNNVYEVTLSGSDGSNTTDLDITVTVTGVNDNNPTVTGLATVNYAENGTAAIATYTITDADAGDTVSVLVLTGIDVSRFSIPNTGGGTATVTAWLNFTTAPNYEVPTDSDDNNDYEVTLNFSDGSNTTALAITVTVTDEDDPSVFGGALTGAVTEDDSAANSATGTLTISDEDDTDPTITAQTDTDGTYGSFSITSAGVWTYTLTNNDPDTNALDDGEDVTVTFPVTASDSNTQNVVITISGNDDPPTITGPAPPVTFAENGTNAIATYSATDPEGHSISWGVLNQSYIPGTEDWNSFSVSTLSNGDGELKFNPAPNYEAPTDHNSDNVYGALLYAATPSGNNGGLFVAVTVTDLPAVSGLATVDYAENGTAAVVTYTATDADGQAVSVTWSLEGDDSGDFTISAGGALSFASSPDHESATDDNTDNIYDVTVVATDGTEAGRLNVSVTVTGVDEAPTANAGTAQTVAEAAAVTLDGSGSSDPEGVALTYTWTQTAPVAGKGAGLTLDTSTDAAKPTFTAPSELLNDVTLTFSLTVNDGPNTSEAATVDVTVTAGTNDAPTANAGTAQTVAEAAAVTLDGSGSSDPEGVALTYTWTQTAPDSGKGSGVALSDATAAGPAFTAPSELLNDVTLTFSLTVNDGPNTSTAATVDVTVEAGTNDAPTANAGAAQTVAEAAAVTLDGSGSSDPEGADLSYTWTQTAPASGLGSGVALDTTDPARPTFTAPTELLNDVTLTFSLTVNDGTNADSEAATVDVTVIAVPAAPANLSATSGDGAVTLNWTDPGNATIDKYQLSSDGGTSFADIAGSDADTASHTVTGLTNGTAYSFALRAVNASGAGAVSSIAATPRAAVAGVPAAPVGLSATPGDAQVTLSWTDPGDDTIDNYQLSSDGGTSFADIPGSDADTASHTVTGLTNGTEYTFALRAVNDSGDGAVSSIAATPVAVPSAPLGLAAAAGDGAVTLNWTDPGNATIDKYQLSSDGGTSFADIAGSDADTASHTVTGLTNGTEYSFALRAANASGAGAVSSIAATPVAAVAGVPAAPVGLSATPGDAQVTLSWTDPGDATIDNYQVSSDGGTSFADIAGSGADTTGHIVTGLTNGTAYTLALRAVNGSGTGAVSSIAATPVAVPAPPSGLTAAAGDAQVTLSWTDPGNDTITGYELRVDSGAWADIAGSDADTASHTVTGLTNGTEYSFALRAANASGDGAVSSIAATPVAAVAGVPAAPVGLSATPGDAQVTLSWTDPGDDTIDNYQVSSDGGTSFADIAGSGATTTGHIVTGLTNGTAYTLALRAVNGSGTGAVSSIAATPVAVPAAPSGLTAAGDAQVTLSWTDPGNATIDKYQLSSDGGTSFADIAGSDADTASHTVTGLTNGTEYSFALRAANASGDGAVSSIAATPRAAVAGVPAAPVGLSATPGDAQVTLSWTDPGDATIDNYQLSSDGGTSFADIAGSGADTTGHIVTGLTNGTAYTLALRAVNGSGTGAVSSIAATPVAVPAPPSGLTAAAGDAQVTLSWTDPGNDTITGYELRVDSGAWADIAGSDADTASHTVTGLTNGTEYSFALRAANASGDGAVSSIAATPRAAVAGVPAAPVGLSATPGDAQVTLSWTDPGDDTIDNYQLSSDGGTSFADIAGSGADTTGHIVTGLTNGTAYTLALRAVNGSGTGAVSSIAATPVAVPAPPSGLTAAAGDAQVTLSWTDPGNATIDKYQLSSDGGTSFADIAGSDADTASHTVTGLTNGTEYSFALRAANASGDGAVSSIAATPRAAVAGVPAAPVGLSATPGDAQVTLSWTDPGDDTIDNYQLSSDGGTSFADIAGSGATTTGHIVTGLTNGTAYTLALRAVNGSGTGAVSSIAATPVAVPAPPSGLTAAAGDAQVTLSWTDPGNDTITGYELRVDSGAWADIAGSDADTASHTVTGLTNGTEYSFALRAANASGDGAVSSIAATPRAAVAGVPAAPVGLSATPGDAQVTLSWTDPGDATIDNYQLSSDGGTSFADIAGSGADTTGHIVTGLTNGTAYTLALRAVNGSGTGAVSSIAATPVAVPAPPSGLTAAAGDAQVTLSWTDPGNATIDKYQLSSDGGTSFADIAGSDADTASHTVTGLTNGTEYSFALRAANASGDGAVSSIAATPRAAVAGVPAAPVGLSATPGDAQVTLSWTDPGDATIDNYQLSSDGGTSFADIAGSGADTTGHIVTGLTNGTAYTLALRAVNGSGTGAVSSIAATPVAVPAPPSGLTAAAGDAQVTLSWTDPGNATIDKYQLSSDGGTSFADIAGSDADTASHTVTGLTNGTEYSFALRAANASGDGAVSSIAATPRAAVAGVPAAPVGLSATPGDAQVTLSWTDPGDDTIDNYQLSSDGGTSFADIAGSGADTTGHIVTGLTNGTAYTLALRAVNGSGTGAVSSIAATPVAVPAPPSGLTAAAGDAQVTLSWTDPGNDTITGYELRVDSGAWADIPGSDADTASHTVTGLTNGTEYSFALRAVNASGDGAVSSIAATPRAAVAGVPAAPVGLSATPGDAQVT